MRLAAAVCALPLLLVGCRFGEASFETSFDDVAFDAGGTVFSYADSRDAALTVNDDPPVAIAMTWIVFDPKSDLSDFDGASLFAMAHEMAVRDALAIVFDRQGAIEDGSTFSITSACTWPPSASTAAAPTPRWCPLAPAAPLRSTSTVCRSATPTPAWRAP